MYNDAVLLLHPCSRVHDRKIINLSEVRQVIDSVFCFAEVTGIKQLETAVCSYHSMHYLTRLLVVCSEPFSSYETYLLFSVRKTFY
jgi:hypothetical protein